jgi:ribosome-binding protein aMBF1 (putative translation factor)
MRGGYPNTEILVLACRGLNLRSNDYQKAYLRFRKLLRNARVQAGMMQAEAEAASGQPESFISKCESGERRVDFVELQELARLYRIRISFFE